MTTCDLVVALRLHDVTLATAGDRLLIDGPENGVVDDTEIMRHLKERKSELLAILTGDWVAAAQAVVVRNVPGQVTSLMEVFEERAAWLEFCAGLAHPIAEELAYHEIADRFVDPEPSQPANIQMDTERAMCARPPRSDIAREPRVRGFTPDAITATQARDSPSVQARAVANVAMPPVGA